MNTDEALWEGFLKGDKDLFLALYNKYYHTLFFIGLREIKDAQLVKDTIHQLFLYLWDKRGNIQRANNVKSYLITSFLRKLSDDWRKAGRITNLQVVSNDYSSDTQLTPEESLIQKEEQHYLFKTLTNFINELPARQRDLIFMKFYEGLSYNEIVEQTGLSHRTVYNKIHEALKKIKLEISQSRKAGRISLIWLLGLFISNHEIFIK
ncbi:MAG: sigma-70 family RNA polymerase sigma factor [Bacteroidetes bacterium]|nr:sigma-70 family RNA polymerase sigma factor [Bacteroidota bacterium]